MVPAWMHTTAVQILNHILTNIWSPLELFYDDYNDRSSFSMWLEDENVRLGVQEKDREVR